MKFFFIVTSVLKNKDIENKLVMLFQNEKSIENVFDKLYISQETKIKLKNDFHTIYPLENKIRDDIEEKILKLNNIHLVMNFDSLQYYSKEMLFQYKDKKHFEKWIKQINIVSNQVNLKELIKYKKIVFKISSIILDIEKIKIADSLLINNIASIIMTNRKTNQLIKNKVENLSSSIINYMYIFMFILLICTIGFIIILGYKVYKNVGLSVDEIESKVKDGLKTIQNLNDEIEDTQKEVVFTMGAIGESRSKETGNHVKRVAQYSKILALHYGLDEKESEMLKQASPMHDIGKVAIPDAILNKPGRFDAAERKIMDTHAGLGYDMLKHSNRPLLKTAAIVAYQHREKWNGTGYPQGLKGEDIHIYGRITAIADVFDALGSDRCYKKAWDDDRIFNLFREERGNHFDPKLVDIFFTNLDEFLEIRENFKDKF